MVPSRLEVMQHVEQFVAEKLPVFLRDPETNWQPSDYTPDLSSEEGFEALRELRAEAERLPEDALVILVGDMITEEALPSYASWISTLEGVGVSGEPQTAWGAWNRAWCGEENRHGDLLNRWLYLSGRVNMREVEVTVQNLIADGGDTQNENDPYRTFIYTSFQEVATRVSHLNVGKIARASGAEKLYGLSAKIAGDEQRHARAYKYFISKIMEVDANEAVLAFQDMMKKKITMPAMYMRERGVQLGDTFKKFEEVATRAGVYTGWDYVEIVEQLLEDWDLEHLTELSPSAAKAQDFLCRLPGRYRSLLERMNTRGTKKFEVEAAPIAFTWLLPREAISPVS
jgi:acyl-[acyl-carrier-protein] desaturase